MKNKEFTLAIRHLKKFKKYSILNILGLALGMASAIIIILWVEHEISVDQFHKDGDRIYILRKYTKYSDGQTSVDVSMTSPLAHELKKDLPEIEDAVRVTWQNELLFRLGDKVFYEKGHYADSTFFKLFTFPLILGDPGNVLIKPNSVAISESLARKYFDTEKVLGKTINIRDNKEEVYTITGVFKDVPEESSLEFDYILPYEKYLEYNTWVGWGNFHLMTFIKVTPNANMKLLNQKMTDLLIEKGTWKLPVLFSQSIEESYLYGDYNGSMSNPSGRIMFVRIFSAVALFIIFLACMNYTNLATAIATKRAKEVGVKKVFGSGTRGLIKQFSIEAMTLTFIGFLISLILVYLSLPYINKLIDTELKFEFLKGSIIITLLLVPIITGALAGIFPAGYLSSFKPISALKNLQDPKKGVVNLRQSLVVLQFVITIVFIISSFLILKQIKYIQTKALGVEKEDVITFAQSLKVMEQRDAFKQELEKQPGVTQVCYTGDSPLSVGSDTSDPRWKGKDPNETFSIPYLRVDEDFCKTFNVKIVQGRDFSSEIASDRDGILINEEFANLMGFENPVGEIVDYWGRKAEILGVVKNFHIGNMHRPIEHLMIINRQENTWMVMVKLDGHRKAEALKNVEKVFKDFDDSVPFEFEFISEQYLHSFQGEQYLSRFSNLFTTLAIIISCLGLFGLALFTTEQKTKEIGIRKSIGAKTSELVFMIAEGFIKWIVIAFIVASVIAYFAMESWLETFAFRTQISWWVFLLTGLIAMLISAATFSWQTYRAARRNPVEALRYE